MGMKKKIEVQAPDEPQISRNTRFKIFIERKTEYKVKCQGDKTIYRRGKSIIDSNYRHVYLEN